VVLAAGGPIVVSGCGQAGLVNTLEQTRAEISEAPVQAAIGGFHLFGATDDELSWTSERLTEMELGSLLGSHCTGFEAVYRIRQLAGMSRGRAKVGAIGTRYEAGRGIVAGSINQ
jgi:7,8-dihydropterin-6-yl-methyl-4-(beta-D-ribofuranosyl)aminobenzene 5'-phosphate synthase